MSREIALIVARADNGAIGRGGKLPWHLPADLRRFKALTMGRPMIMGRKTFESLGKALPGRLHIVLTRDSTWAQTDADVARTPREAVEIAGDGRIWVIGGAEVFAAFLPFANRIELTEVHADIAGDTFMPAPGPEWREVSREDHAAEGDRPAYSFVTLERAA